MKLTVAFDRGNGVETLGIGPGAQVAWEIKTKQKISNLSDGVGMNDLVVLTMEQLKINGETVSGSSQAFANTLIDINPVAETKPDPTTGADPLPDS